MSYFHLIILGDIYFRIWLFFNWNDIISPASISIFIAEILCFLIENSTANSIRTIFYLNQEKWAKIVFYTFYGIFVLLVNEQCTQRARKTDFLGECAFSFFKGFVQIDNSLVTLTGRIFVLFQLKFPFCNNMETWDTEHTHADHDERH